MSRQIRHWIENRRFRRTFSAAEKLETKNFFLIQKETQLDSPEGSIFLHQQLMDARKERLNMLKRGLFIEALNVTSVIWLTRYLLFRYKGKN